MPHLVLEYTANLGQRDNPRKLMLTLHQVLHKTGGIRLDNCKSRIRSLDAYAIGDGDPDYAFAHLDVRFMAGRSAPVKQQIGQELLAVLQDEFRETLLQIQITVEIRDIDTGTYFKYPQGTLTPQ